MSPIIAHPRSHVPELIIEHLARVLFLDGALGEHQLGSVADLPVVLGQEHQRFFTAAGWSKADIRRALWDQISPLARESDGRASGSADRKESCWWPPGVPATRSPPSCPHTSG